MAISNLSVSAIFSHRLRSTGVSWEACVEGAGSIQNGSNTAHQGNFFTGAGLGANNPYIIRGHNDADARLNFEAEL